MNHILKYQIDLSDGSFGRNMDKAQSQTKSLDSLVSKLATGLGAAFATDRLVSYGKEAVQVSSQVNNLERAIKFAGGKEGAENLSYVKAEANKLGVDIMAAEKGFKTLSAALMGNKKLASAQKDIFEGVGMAMSALGGDSEQFEGSLLAISQMASKGTVSAEELRGQLAERMPGAFQIMARAVGVSEEKLGKMMEKGEVIAADVLPKFAAELKKTFGDQAIANANTFEASMNRQNNAILEQQVSIGEKLQPAYLSLQDIQLKGLQVGNGLISFYTQHNQSINTGVAILVAATVAYKASAIAETLYTTAMARNLGVMAASTMGTVAHRYASIAAAAGTNGLVVATNALTIAMMKNPITAAFVGISILVAGYMAWNASADDTVKKQEDVAKAVDTTNAEMNAHFRLLSELNKGDTKRKDLIDTINSKYGEYLPKLLTEKSSLEDIAKAQKDANKEFENKLFLQDMDAQLKPIGERISKYTEDIYAKKMKRASIPASYETSLLTDEISKLEMLKKGAEINQDNKRKELMAIGKKAGFHLNGNNEKPSYVKKSEESVSQNKSVRNVTVTIDSLVKEMKNYFEGGTGDVKTTTGIRQEMTKLMVGVVSDSERALG